jgi:tol-pal system protein YbgF
MAGTSLRALKAAALGLLLLPAAEVNAQQAPAARGSGAEAQAGPQQSKTGVARPQGAPAGKAQQSAPAAGGDAGLRERVEQLEEQLVDLQVVIGTLESLARPGGANASAAPAFRPSESGGLTANDQARLDGMETQIRALTTQVEQLSEQMRAQNGQPRRSDAVGPLAQDMTAPAAPGGPPPPGASRFGSTTVTSGSSDLAGGPTSDGASRGPKPPDTFRPGPPAPVSDQVVAAAPTTGAVDGGDPKQLYETAYGYLLQQDYGAAQAGFSEFLRKYPKDPLAPNALYWLGETHYVQKNYSDAAEAFDLVAASFASSAKAPDAQLKRAMSLAQLGKKDDACAAFRQLASKYPNAPAHVKAKAESERQRAGCS